MNFTRDVGDVFGIFHTIEFGELKTVVFLLNERKKNNLKEVLWVVE